VALPGAVQPPLPGAPNATALHITDTLARLSQQAAAVAAAAVTAQPPPPPPPLPQQSTWVFPPYQPAVRRKKGEKKKKKKRDREDKENVGRKPKKSRRSAKLDRDVEATILGGDPTLPSIDDEEKALLKEAMSEVPDMQAAVYAASDLEQDDEDDVEGEEGGKRSPVPLPPAGRGVLMINGFSKDRVEKKRVGFADGYGPGEGSPSEGEETPPPPPLPATEIRARRSGNGWPALKIKVIRQLIDDEDEGADEEPPPPPPGSPPPCPYYFLGPAGALLTYMQPIDPEVPAPALAALPTPTLVATTAG